MTGKKLQKGGRYLYAVIEGAETRQYGKIGIAERNVYTISNGLTTAVVSDCVPNKSIRPERRNIKAHQEVMKCLMKETTPLPMAFGIIADSPQAVKTILTNNQEVLLDQLTRVKDKTEMGLRAFLDVSNIFEYFISTHSELRNVRDQYFGTNREPSPEDKIELGRTFDSILNEDREKFTEQVEDILAPNCFECKRNKCRNESELMNLVCLVGRDQEEQLEEAIYKAAGLFDNNFSFDYNGPWAPHNFVDIDLSI